MLCSCHIHLVSTLAAQELAVTQFASPRLASYFISPESFPVYHTSYQVLPSTSSQTCTTHIILYPRASNVLYRLALVLEIEVIETTPSCSKEEEARA